MDSAEVPEGRTRTSKRGARCGMPAQCQPVDGVGGEVLEAVDGDVGAAVEDGALDFAGEDADAAHFGQGAGAVLVAGGGDVDELDVVSGVLFQQRGDVLGLPEREAAGAGGDADWG